MQNGRMAGPPDNCQEEIVSDASVQGSGTREDPWKLKTPPGTSEFQMYRDEAADPPALVCQVGKTELRYHLRCIDDLHAMLKRTATGCRSAAPTSRSPPPRAPSRPGAAAETTRSAAGTA